MVGLGHTWEKYEICTAIADERRFDSTVFKTLLSIVDIGYIVEFSAGVLHDFGQDSLADKLIFCGKLIILVLAVPILESVLGLVNDLLRLIA